LSNSIEKYENDKLMKKGNNQEIKENKEIKEIKEYKYEPSNLDYYDDNK